MKKNDKEYESKIDDHRNSDTKEKKKLISKKFSELPLTIILQQVNLDNIVFFSFDPMSLYATAMSIMDSIL